MSKIIKYNDYVQINPDRRILSLDKSEKIQLIDNMLERSYNGGKGLVITYDLSHSGRRINNRIYSTKGQQRGIDSLTSPYPKPILKNHDQSGEPIGRFIGGEWQNLYDEAKEFLQSSQAALDIHSAFAGDDPEKIYDTLKAMNLIENKQWPGLGRMRVQANITDEEAIKKFMDGRYMTFSAGSTTDRHVCSICKTDWAKDGMCEHRHGKTYDGEICVFITGDFLVMEGSVVNTPADDLSQLVHMEMMDSEDTSKKITDKDIYLDEFIMTDSKYELGDNNGLQTTEQIDAYQEKAKEEKEEKEVIKKFDHEMSISESQMMELHQKGETYITQKGDNQTMVIKVKYSGKMRKDNLEEDEFALFESEVNELVEELIDEKTFKVPAGAKGNAQKVLNWKKEKGSEVKGMTPVGWARARQLATKSEIGLSTVKRMAAFNRHRKNAAVDPKYKSEPWKDRGYVAWLGWGGTSGIDWAVKISAANDSLYTGCSEGNKEMYSKNISEMIGDFEKDAYKSSPKGKGAKTPAKPSERIKGSKKNKEGSAKKANSKIEVGSVLSSLKEKVSSHNKKYGKEKGKRVTLGMLKAVYRRGAGAFSSTHRPGMSRSGWGVARVNAFLKLVRSGRPSNPKYKQDNDLLPAGHPRKSSTKSTKQKDFSMVEKETTEQLDVNEELELEEDSDRDADLQIEAVEPTEEQQEVHDESLSEDGEETLDAEDSLEIDWELLDLAMQGILIQEDAQLTTEARKALPDSAFCGPERSFPIPDCAHVTAAKRLIGRYKGSDSTKSKIMACVNKKASSLSCEKSEDYMQLRKDFEDLQNQYSDLEDKFKTVLESLIVKSKKKDAETVEIETNDDLIEDNTTILDKKVENPSEHIQDEKVSSKKEVKLPSFEQKIVDEYKRIKNEDGDYAASLYLNTKSFYLPKGFDPNKF